MYGFGRSGSDDGRVVYITFLREPMQRLISQYRQFPASTNFKTWWENGRQRLCGTTWHQVVGVQVCNVDDRSTPAGGEQVKRMKPSYSISEQDRQLAQERIRDDVLVLLMERYDESIALLEALSYADGTPDTQPTLLTLARHRYRCFNPSGDDPAGPCRAGSERLLSAPQVNPAEVFPPQLIPEIEDILVPDRVLYDYAALVFDYRLREVAGDGMKSGVDSLRGRREL